MIELIGKVILLILFFSFSFQCGRIFEKVEREEMLENNKPVEFSKKSNKWY